jgi:soluble lytic murein transglycosylase-like protein
MADEEKTWQALAKDKEEYSKVKYNDPRLDEFTGVVEQRYKLPPGLLLAIKNAGERSNTGQVSSAGAKGVMQFIDNTRKSYDHDPGNPFASIDAAGRYFSDLLSRYDGNVKAAITEYNGGVVQARNVMKGGNPTAKETIDYLARIKSYMQDRSATTAGGK